MVTTPGFLPGEFHGQRSLAGYSPRGHKKSDTTNTQGVWCSDILSTELSGLENISDKLAIIVIFKKSSPSLLDTRKIRSRAINHIIERRPMKTSFVTRTLLTGDISVFTYITNCQPQELISEKNPLVSNVLPRVHIAGESGLGIEMSHQFFETHPL